QTLVNPTLYYQCPTCGRNLCDDCGSVLTSCPAHPQEPSTMITMPKRCEVCGSTFTNVADMWDTDKCPICGDPF
ncbi:MAG: hypothetical protein ACXACA_02520, partial [Candidatus Ranarchaeia archaeon]